MSAETSALAVAQGYFDAWNARDAQAVLATFAEGGTYQDPGSGGPVSGEAFAGYMQGLIAILPDVSFEVVSKGEAGEGLVAAQWIMRGTNSGPFMGLPPTGKTVEIHGSDFIRIQDGKIQSVVGYFDAGEMPRQLGLQVVVQPNEIGPFSFGTGVRTWGGKTGKPGAFSITALQARSSDEAKQVQEMSRQIATEMLGMEGFLGLVGVTIGQRMVTISAWESPEHPAQMMRGGTHSEAMKKFFGSEVASSGFTSVWKPERINVLWVRCEACGKMQDSANRGSCGCGSALPGPMAYW